MSYFTREEKKALGLFFLQISALPLILLAATMFFLGFYISDVVKDKTIAGYEKKMLSIIEDSEKAKREAIQSAEAIKSLNAEGILQSEKIVRKLADILKKDKELVRRIDNNYSSLENDVIDAREKIDIVSKDIRTSVSRVQKSVSDLQKSVTDLETAFNNVMVENVKNVENPVN